MSRVYVLCGIPGSGKSTFAKALSRIEDIKIISSDQVRNDNPDFEEFKIFPEVYRLIGEELKAGRNCILDATNVNKYTRARMKKNLDDLKLPYTMAAYYFVTDWVECKRRVKIRNKLKGERKFPIKKVKEYFDKFEIPTVEEGFEFVKKGN